MKTLQNELATHRVRKFVVVSFFLVIQYGLLKAMQRVSS
jgi:hypothetical protein